MPNKNRQKQVLRNRKHAGKLSPQKFKAAPQAKPEDKSSLRDFLMLRFPKQKATVSNKGKRKTWNKKKLANHQRRKIAKLSKAIIAAGKQPQAEKTELSPLSQFPAIQAPSRRKFIKMVGMTAAASALWRQAVAAGGSGASSWTSFNGAGTVALGSGYQSQSAANDIPSGASSSPATYVENLQINFDVDATTGSMLVTAKGKANRKLIEVSVPSTTIGGYSTATPTFGGGAYGRVLSPSIQGLLFKYDWSNPDAYSVKVYVKV